MRRAAARATAVGAAPPFRPQAVVFDLDGLLVDSEPAWSRAEQRLVEELGRPWDPSIHAALLGLGPEEAAAMFVRLTGGAAQPEQVRRRLQTIVSAEFGRGVEPRPGALALVTALHGQVPVAVATNAVRALADQLLAGAGLDRFFDVVVAADQVAQPKPAPDVYERACAASAAQPRCSVALEDSAVGAAAAKRAGMWVIGCPATPAQVTPDADAVITSLEELDPAVLL